MYEWDYDSDSQTYKKKKGFYYKEKRSSVKKKTTTCLCSPHGGVFS